MAKVSVEKSVTVNKKDSYAPYKVDIIISDIDTEKDIDVQITEALTAIEKVGDALNAPIAQELADVSGYNIEGFGVANELEEYIENDKEWKRKLVEWVKEVKPLLENLQPVKEKKTKDAKI